MRDDELRAKLLEKLYEFEFDAISYRLGCLAGNLGEAGALCHAWQLGAMWLDPLWRFQDPLTSDVHASLVALDWRPGCGTPIPLPQGAAR